ncbi:GNAT family N-acetyltransferase [Maribacter sp. 2307ULW6-5]|uniref:GNAT family N-acetyltransferase n=1 Tax=Maribacter sp. 2307ULW6-5 TaxID=3386275 RepID=UPI0039BD787F
MAYEDTPLQKNEDKKRFEINVDGHYAFIDYKPFGKGTALVHTETDPELAGKGAAAAVVKKTLQYFDDHKMTLFPFCPYVFAYIKRHPEWKRIVSPRFKGYGDL